MVKVLNLSGKIKYKTVNKSVIIVFHLHITSDIPLLDKNCVCGSGS